MPKNVSCVLYTFINALFVQADVFKVWFSEQSFNFFALKIIYSKRWLEKRISILPKWSAIAGNEQGLLLRWYSMLVQPERQTISEPKAEDMYKS